MQRPDAPKLVDINSPLPTNTNNPSMQKQKQEATAWETCLAESKDTKRYPRVPVIDGPFQGFEEMLNAKEHGEYNVGTWILLAEPLFLSFFMFIYFHLLPRPSPLPILTTPLITLMQTVNPFHRPTGPTHEHITLLQNLYAKGKSIDDIAAFLVVTYPHLMKGWKDGTEFDRRVQIHGLVNLWVSCWAPRFGGAEGGMKMGMGVGGQSEGEGEGYGGGKEMEKEGREAVQRWLRG